MCLVILWMLNLKLTWPTLYENVNYEEFCICSFDRRIVRELVFIKFVTSLTIVLWVQVLCPFSRSAFVNTLLKLHNNAHYIPPTSAANWLFTTGKKHILVKCLSELRNYEKKNLSIYTSHPWLKIFLWWDTGLPKRAKHVHKSGKRFKL